MVDALGGEKGKRRVIGLFAASAVQPSTREPHSARKQAWVPALFHPGLEFSLSRRNSCHMRKGLNMSMIFKPGVELSGFVFFALET